MIASIESIWEEFNKPLKSYIKKRINNYQDVEDILQIVFLKIYNNINNLRVSNNLQSWIYTITRNTIIDFYRPQNNDMHIECLPEDIYIEQQDEITVNKELAECLKTMIQYLPEKYKQAIIMIEFEKLSQKEIALQLGLSVSGAKSRVQRARLRLKEMVLDCCYIEKDKRGNIIDYKIKSKDCNYC
ncbi:MAG TPA: RNA polymerase sigma factor SigZ [Lachnoclostridium phytofermentans]|uniref:RNA polymerase sigma factor n=1 Tax=Lachnoclostridium phytofermentans TaxID=66219 RepID=A0A3D2X7V2_9FIRM|nr:RNA polymerase sigma factor SigZ [Lachnoclostridium sp.]HCL02713.1 RNA polymerase sigma factor SigZ [Lachnoclostridium phytofermentans]